jgi:hypothetical protein
MSSDDSDASKPQRPDKPPAPEPRPDESPFTTPELEEIERERLGSGQQRRDDDSQ